MPRKQIIIPMDIWNLDDLNVTDKLVASVVFGYTRQGKPCFMTNPGFSKLLHVSKRTISASVNRLIDGGYIEALALDHRRQLAWKRVEESAREGRSQLLGRVAKSAREGRSQLPPVIKTLKSNLNKDLNMNGEIRDLEKTPASWEDVRDYFRALDGMDWNEQFSTHVVAWAKDFFSYYDSRGWQNKHGAITKWRPVALAWFKRNATKVPRKAVKRVDYDALRRDLKWHQRRLDNYLADERRDLAYKESRAIEAIKQQLSNEA